MMIRTKVWKTNQLHAIPTKATKRYIRYRRIAMIFHKIIFQRIQHVHTELSKKKTKEARIGQRDPDMNIRLIPFRILLRLVVQRRLVNYLRVQKTPQTRISTIPYTRRFTIKTTQIQIINLIEILMDILIITIIIIIIIIVLIIIDTKTKQITQLTLTIALITLIKAQSIIFIVQMKFR